MVITENIRGDFDRDGYVILRQVLTASAVAELISLLSPLYENFSELEGKKARDIGKLPDETLKQPEVDRPTRIVPELKECEAMDSLREIASEVLEVPAHYTFDHSICKMPFSGIATAWHQDQGYLGKDVKLNSINFWIPLVDVTEANGSLAFVPGSHKGELFPHKALDGMHPHVRSLENAPENAVTPSLKIGDVSMHHPKVIHGAGPNNTDQPRLTWAVHFSRHGRMAYFLPGNLIGLARRAVAGRFC